MNKQSMWEVKKNFQVFYPRTANPAILRLQVAGNCGRYANLFFKEPRQ